MTRRNETSWKVPPVKVKMIFHEALFSIENDEAPIIVFPIDGNPVEYTIDETGQFTFTIKGKIKTQLNFKHGIGKIY